MMYLNLKKIVLEILFARRHQIQGFAQFNKAKEC